MSHHWYFPFIDSYRILIFISVQMLIALTNIILMKRLEKFPKTSKQPKVSVLVPARNEEKTIAFCFDSLRTQTYPNYEIIVLDDNSEDRTGEILHQIKSEKLTIIKGKPLPEGWIGKSWACYQLSQMATGELLLFTDADTVFSPQTLSCAVSAFVATDADLITAVNRNQVKTFGEQITVPFIVWSVFTILPLAIAYLFPKTKSFSAANGKFMLFKREFYRKIGGHQAVKHSAVEDVELARITKAQGGKWRLFDASHLISSRMYYSFSEALEGFSKNYFALFGYKILIALFVWFWMGLITFHPISNLIKPIITHNFNNIFLCSAVSMLFTIILWLLTSIKFGLPLHIFLLYPIIVIVAIFIGIRSIYLAIINKLVWKGRVLKNIKIRWL
ncbi:MAG: glycosyltransferase family 2 protein [candidate division WOR-3 bacterium]|nr:glycosyltransferase family 2 protein [candidate division WOR-3 bacterium]